MEIWFINLRKSLEIQTSLIFSNVLLTVSTEQGILEVDLDLFYDKVKFGNLGFSLEKKR